MKMSTPDPKHSGATDEAPRPKVNWGPEVPGTEQVEPGLYVAKESRSIFVLLPSPKTDHDR
jgi:hypothetical protein